MVGLKHRSTVLLSTRGRPNFIADRSSAFSVFVVDLFVEVDGERGVDESNGSGATDQVEAHDADDGDLEQPKHRVT